jgi:hypothetical protein
MPGYQPPNQEQIQELLRLFLNARENPIFGHTHNWGTTTCIENEWVVPKKRKKKVPAVNITYDKQVTSLSSHKKQQPIPPEIKPQQPFRPPECKWKVDDVFVPVDSANIRLVANVFYDKLYRYWKIVDDVGGTYFESAIETPKPELLRNFVDNYMMYLAKGNSLGETQKRYFRAVVSALP